MSGRLLAVLVAIAIATAGAAGQKPTFRAGVRTVAVYATVNDREGRLVPGLAQDEFTILDDGKPAAVSLFSNDPQPITVAVMLDMSNSMVTRFLRVRESTLAFVEALEPGDRASIGTFGEEIAVSPHLTDDKAVLERILREELWPGGGTPLWAGLDAAMTSLAGESGRRVVLVVTDGADTASDGFPKGHSGKGVRNRAKAEDFMVYAIGIEGFSLEPEMITTSEETGGGHFKLASLADLTETFSRVVEELRHQYLLGFVPQELDGKTHKLRVSVKSGLKVRARTSYVADTER